MSRSALFFYVLAACTLAAGVIHFWIQPYEWPSYIAWLGYFNLPGYVIALVLGLHEAGNGFWDHALVVGGTAVFWALLGILIIPAIQPLWRGKSRAL
jgi:hypothetical protein